MAVAIAGACDLLSWRLQKLTLCNAIAAFAE